MKQGKLLLIISVLCALLCLFVASCGSGDDTNEQKSNENTSQTEKQENPKDHEHKYGAWVETKKATCTENGEMSHSCSCGDVKTEVVLAKGHKYMSEKCSNCGNVISKSDGLEFTMNEDEKSYSVSGIGSCTSTEISIPSEYEGKPVTKIKEGAFENCAEIIVVIIPNSVIEIENNSFKGCSKLTTVAIPESVKSIGNSAFEGCVKLLIVVIGEGIESIGDRAFADCESLSSLFIPSSLKNVGINAFLNCTKLVLKTLLQSFPMEWGLDNVQANFGHIHTYGNWNVKVESTCISTGLKEQYCSCGFKNVEALPLADHEEQTIKGYEPTCTENGLTDGKKCTVCQKVTKEQQIISPRHTFDKGECTLCGEKEKESQGLLFTLRYDNKSYSVSIGSCTDSVIYIPGWHNGLPVTHIADDGFFNNSNATNIIIGEGIVSIGRAAFGTNKNLKKITLPSTLKTIGQDAFINDSKLIGIELPDGVQSIGAQAFYNCSALTSFKFPSGVSSVSNGMFINCVSLVRIELSENMNDFDVAAFYNCPALTYNEYENARYLGSASNPYLVMVSLISSDITSTSIHIDTKIIANSAFANCQNLVNVTIPQGVEKILPWTFSGCKNLVSIVIPNGVTFIGEGAFYQCQSLENVSLPSTLKSVSERAFQYCSVLKYNEFDGALYLGNEENPYVVLMMAKSKDIVDCQINEGTKVIYAEAFKDCKSLSKIIIPNGVFEIGKASFSNCVSALELVIPNTVTKINPSAFAFCKGLTSIEIPNSVIEIGTSAFARCESAKEITIGNSVVSIGNSAFDGCISCTELIIPDSVVSIGEYAFASCNALTKLHIGVNVESFGTYICYGDTALNEIHIRDLKKWCEISFSDEYANPLYYGKNLYLNGELVVDIVLNEDVSIINHYAFAYCQSLKSVVMKGVRIIGISSFVGCSNLDKVVISKTVQTIDSIPFKDCNKLTIYCEANVQPENWYVNWNKYGRPVIWGYVIEE